MSTAGPGPEEEPKEEQRLGKGALTTLPDSAVLGLRFVLADAWPPGLGTSLSSDLVQAGTIEQLLGAPCPGERSGP